MPRDPIHHDEPLASDLPRIRVTPSMEKILRRAAKLLNISISEIVRACLSYHLGFHKHNSKQYIALLRDMTESAMDEEGNHAE